MNLPSHVSLAGDLPPELEMQSRAGTCTAHAVVTLLEYLTDCRTRLSVSFLFAAMRIKVGEWLDRNLAFIMHGERGDADFEHVFRDNLTGLRCVLSENAPESAASQRFLEVFRERAFRMFAQSRGCPIRFASEALQEYGICRHVLWPEGEGLAPTFAADVSGFPDNARIDARRRRLANGLDFLPEPGNVESVKAMLAGANGNRRMPVVLAIAPDAANDAHAVLAVGYRDDASQAGGGFFLVRDGSSARCQTRLPYAVVKERCTEAATIIQPEVDYVGDGYGGFKTRRRVRLAACFVAGIALAVACIAGWWTWRTSPAVVDAPFDWLAHPAFEPERISVVGEASYGSCLKCADPIRRHFFRPTQWDRVDASLSSNGVAAATSRNPGVLMFFARSSVQVCSKADKDAMARYLNDGGTVLAFVCNCNRPLMADFLAPYGAKIQGLSGNLPIKATVPVLREAQLDGYSWFRVTEMTDDWHAMIVTDDDARAPVMAFRRVGKGKLFCVAQQLFGAVGGRRFRNMDWWGDFLFACVSDSMAFHAETK